MVSSSLFSSENNEVPSFSVKEVKGQLIEIFFNFSMRLKIQIEERQ
tara:strand:+ start:949 stop:1086 length:138 start_codon:yes stop_codon:yes gene_type:complete